MRKRAKPGPLSGFWPVFRKELIHLRRNSSLFIFLGFNTLVILLLLGFAIETNVRQIRTVVFDLSQSPESKELIQRLINTDTFNVTKMVFSDEELNDSIVSGEARVGIKIKADYSRQLLEGDPTSILVLLDGSNGIVTSQAGNVVNIVMLQETLKRFGVDTSLVEARSSILFNPDTKTPYFLIPGLIAIQLQGIILFFASTAVARERERGTLDQLYLTPVRPLAVIIGKMLPYSFMGFLQQLEILVFSYFAFGITIAGSYLSLLILTVPFLILALSIGLMISVRAETPVSATRLATTIDILSIFLSGYVFEIDSMPRVFQIFSRLLPTSHYIEICRGIIVRGADLEHLWQTGIIMLVMGTVITFLAAREFDKRNPTLV